MAKRMSETEKWKDPWFSNLENDWKLIWLYLLDDCTHAGIYQINIPLLNFHCRTSITLEDLLDKFHSRLIQLSDDKIFIHKFIIYQYGVDFKSSKAKAVLSAKKSLESLGFIGFDDEGNQTLILSNNNHLHTLNKGLTNPLLTTTNTDTNTDTSSNTDSNPNTDSDSESNWIHLLPKTI